MRVLAATDLSVGADAALGEAAALASNDSDALAVMHVLPAIRPIGGLDGRAKELVRARFERVDPARLVEVFVDTGSASAAILKRAESWHADTIVVGSHGHSMLVGVLGRVAERVARHAPCDVLVARGSKSKGWVLAATISRTRR